MCVCVFFFNQDQNPLSANLKSTIKICQFIDLKTEICELLKDGKVKVLPMTDSTTDMFISSRNTTLYVFIFLLIDFFVYLIIWNNLKIFLRSNHVNEVL